MEAKSDDSGLESRQVLEVGRWVWSLLSRFLAVRRWEWEKGLGGGLALEGLLVFICLSALKMGEVTSDPFFSKSWLSVSSDWPLN